MKRPSFVTDWRSIEAPAAPPSSPEDFGFASELSAATGVNHLRVAHLRIPPGLRGYPPMAMDDLEIFAFVLEGAPDLWADGSLHRLDAGDGIALNARTGMAHTLVNNTDADVRVLVMSEPFRRNNAAALSAKTGAPKRKRAKPAFVAHWTDILTGKSKRYPGSTEDQGIDAPFGRRARFSRIGVHAEVLKPGRRTSYPHAERDEDEFVFVVAGKIEAWNDGRITKMGAGDFIGWRSGTGVTHTILNNGDEDALLIVGGEASRMKNQYWYPFHPSRNKAAGKNHWADHPVPKRGPHDGLPDALRERVPPRARRTALAANTAVLKLRR